VKDDATESLLEEARPLAEELVERYWAHICAVAKVLKQHGLLSHAQVEDELGRLSS
jgi:hypothetical protein